LRRLGIPFGKGKVKFEGRPQVTYNFEDLMELALALLLRVYGTLPDVVTNGLRSFRNDLRPIHRQAYLDSLRLELCDLTPEPSISSCSSLI